MPPAIPWIPLFFRFVATPAQIYIKRRTEVNPRFKDFVIRHNHNWQKFLVKRRLKSNNIERTDEQIAIIAKTSDEKAIIAAGELVSSIIGTIISIVAIYIPYYFYDEQKVAKEKQKKLEWDSMVEKTNQMQLDLANLKKLNQTLRETNVRQDRIIQRLEVLEKESQKLSKKK